MHRIEIVLGCRTLRFQSVQSQDMLYILSLNILYTVVRGFAPVLDDRRALEPQIDLAKQGGAVVDQNAVVDGDQVHPFAAK
jgi:hypothetical protein